MLKVSKDFYIYELVPSQIYRLYGNMAIQFVDKIVLQGLQEIRNNIGKSITINDYYDHGLYEESGYRESFSKTGAKNSSHKRSIAWDIKPSGMTIPELYKHIVDNWNTYKNFFTTIEDIKYTMPDNGRHWLHIDNRNIPLEYYDKSPNIVTG